MMDSCCSLIAEPPSGRAEVLRNIGAVFACGGRRTLFDLYAYGQPISTMSEEGTAPLIATATDGPGVLVIFDVPEPSAAPAICGVVVAAGTLQNVKLTRLLTQDEVMQVRQKASKLRSAYTPPGG